MTFLNTSKLIVSGDKAEFLYFDGVSIFGHEQRSAFRAKTKCKRLINSNAWQWFDEKLNPYMPLFLTLTFEDDVVDLDDANKLWREFVKRFNYHIFNTKKSHLKYIVIPEIQEKRYQKYGVPVWHYHALFFNVPFIDDLHRITSELWGNGYVYYVSLKKDDISDIGAYVAKYITKTMVDPNNLGKKRYMASRGLKKPKILKQDDVGMDAMRSLLDLLPGPDYVYSDNVSGYFEYFSYNSVPWIIHRYLSD